MTHEELKEWVDATCTREQYSHWKRDSLFDGIEKGLSFEQLELMSRCARSVIEMNEIKDCFLMGMSLDEVRVFANCPVSSMRLIKEGFLKGASIDQMKLYADLVNDFSMALYQCGMSEFTIAFEQKERELGYEVKKSVRDRAEERIGNELFYLKKEIIAMRKACISKVIEETFQPLKSKMEVDTLISEGKKKTKGTSKITQKAKNEQKR